MSDLLETMCVIFSGSIYVGRGPLRDVVHAAKKVFDSDKIASLLIFNDITSETIGIDFRGNVDDVLARLAGQNNYPDEILPSTPTPAQVSTGPGRPKLGVVAREVTLLPRHWEWLNSQPGGASVSLRKLVEEAKRQNAEKDRIRLAQESCYRFMSTMAGDMPGFEEATRALFAGDKEQFEARTSNWPDDIVEHVRTLGSRTFTRG